MPEATRYTVEQLKLNVYQVWIGNPNFGTGQNMTNICTSIQWDYDLDQACEKYTVTFVKVADLAKKIKPLDHLWISGIKVDSVFGIGNQIEPLKFGIIIDGGIMTNARGELQITAYNIFWYLVVNKSSHMLQNEKASEFFTRIAAKYALPLGKVDDTQVMIGPSAFLERTLYDMFVSTLAITRDVAFEQRLRDMGGDALDQPIQTRGPRFYLRDQVGKIALLRKTYPAYIWKFDVGNIMQASSKWSAHNYRNATRVFKRAEMDIDSGDILASQEISSDGDISPLAQIPKDFNTDQDILTHGLMVESVSLVGAYDPELKFFDDKEQAEFQARELYLRLKKIEQGGTFTSFNVNTLGPGDPVYIEETVSGLVGQFYIRAGMHRVTPTESSMSLTINFEDVLPEAYKTRIESSSDLLGGIL